MRTAWRAAATRRRLALASIAIAILCLTASGGAYSTQNRKWPAGAVTLHLELGAAKSALIDGSGDFNSVADAALTAWNPFLNGVTLQGVRDSAAISSNNRVNTVSFGDDVFGEPFGSGVLAVTQTFYNPRSGNIIESDVVFNRARNWNSYRGRLQSAIDLRRVAIHEFGHVIGLDHPDDEGQSIGAIMNSRVGNIDALQTDDIEGAAAIYGRSAAAAATVSATLPAGSRLLPGQAVTSPDLRFRLTYQTDGNLVLYDDSQRTALWSSGTAGMTAGQAVMQGDGNFVVYDASGRPRWYTATAPSTNARFVVQSDGNLVLLSADNRALWDRISNPEGFVP